MLKLKKGPNQKGEISTIIIISILLASIVIPVTVKLVQEKQEIRKYAASPAPNCPAGTTKVETYGECCGCNTARQVKRCYLSDGSKIYKTGKCDYKNQSICGNLCPSPSPYGSPQTSPTVGSGKTCHAGCCGQTCGSCPTGQACNIPNGACPDKKSCNPAGYEYHSACRDFKCVQVPGPGKDECDKYGGDSYCRQQDKQPEICTPNTCCGENLKCNSTGTACNIPDKTGECAKKYKCWPNNCCQEGYRCNSAGTDCNVPDVKCTQNYPTPTFTPTSAPTPTSPSTLVPFYPSCYTPYLCSSNLQKICLPYAYTETESRLGWYPCPEGSRCVTGKGCDFSPTPKYSYPQRVQMCQEKQEGECLDIRGQCITFYGGELHNQIAYQACPAGTICIGSSCVTPTSTQTPPSIPTPPSTPTPSPSFISPTPPLVIPTPTAILSQKNSQCQNVPSGNCLDNKGQCLIRLGTETKYYFSCPQDWTCSVNECISPTPMPGKPTAVSPASTLTPTPRFLSSCRDNLGCSPDFSAVCKYSPAKNGLYWHLCPVGKICKERVGCIPAPTPTPKPPFWQDPLADLRGFLIGLGDAVINLFDSLTP